MNLRILSNTKLASLLVVSLTSIPNILASNSNNIVNNSFNFDGLSINRSAITKKISNTNNGYIFTQFGHNLSINPSGDSVKDKLLKTRGSLYADLAYRKLINRTCYIDAGIGVNGGILAKGNNEVNGKINIFGGIKHESGVEATVQLSAPFKGNINKGGILNIKYDNKNDYMYKWAKFSIEGGYSDLYNKAGEGAFPFIALRYDTRGIISYLGKIGKQINKYINIQIIYLAHQGEFKNYPWVELTIGDIKRERSIREGYYGVDEIYKNNTLEYGWTNEEPIVSEGGAAAGQKGDKSGVEEQQEDAGDDTSGKQQQISSSAAAAKPEYLNTLELNSIYRAEDVAGSGEKAESLASSTTQATIHDADQLDMQIDYYSRNYTGSLHELNGSIGNYLLKLYRKINKRLRQIQDQSYEEIKLFIEELEKLIDDPITCDCFNSPICYCFNSPCNCDGGFGDCVVRLRRHCYVLSEYIIKLSDHLNNHLSQQDNKQFINYLRQIGMLSSQFSNHLTKIESEHNNSKFNSQLINYLGWFSDQISTILVRLAVTDTLK